MDPLFWLYLAQFGVWQIYIGTYFGNKPGEGRNGAILGLLFSGPLTLLSHHLDSEYTDRQELPYFGILFLIISTILLIHTIIRSNRKNHPE